jgi:hypothetical protein
MMTFERSRTMEIARASHLVTHTLAYEPPTDTHLTDRSVDRVLTGRLSCGRVGGIIEDRGAVAWELGKASGPARWGVEGKRPLFELLWVGVEAGYTSGRKRTLGKESSRDV